MANPMPNEDKLLQEIKESGIPIDPRLWQILSHHIGNDLQVIHLSVKCLAELPPWIKGLHMFAAHFNRPFRKIIISHDINAVCSEALTRVESITDLMKRLKASLAGNDKEQ